MPESVSDCGPGLCPFLSVCEVAGSGLLHLAVSPPSLTRFGTGRSLFVLTSCSRYRTFCLHIISIIQFALLFIYNSLVETNLYLTGPQPAEQHFYPSSLKFSLAAVGEREHCRATHLGLQRKVCPAPLHRNLS